MTGPASALRILRLVGLWSCAGLEYQEPDLDQAVVADYAEVAVVTLAVLRENESEVVRALESFSSRANSQFALRTTMESAARSERELFATRYEGRIGAIPTLFTDLHVLILTCHRAFQSAMHEYLRYWSDGDAAHLRLGRNLLEVALLLTDAATEKAIMALELQRLSTGSTARF